MVAPVSDKSAGHTYKAPVAEWIRRRTSNRNRAVSPCFAEALIVASSQVGDVVVRKGSLAVPTIPAEKMG